MTSFYRFAALALLFAVAACSRVPDSGQIDLSPQAFGTPQADEVTALSVHSGGVYVVGTTRGSLYHANAGGSDVFVGKLRADGRTRWSLQFGTAGDDAAGYAATDPGRYLYVFGTTTGSLAGTNRGGQDFFLRKYTPTGEPVWTRQFGLETGDFPLDLTVTGSGVYAAGYSREGYVVYHYRLNGNLAAKRLLQVPAELSYPQLSLDSAGNAYVAGEVAGRTDPDLGTDENVRLLRFSGAGTPLWDRVYDDSFEDSVYQLTAQGGSVFLLGGTWEFADDDDLYVLYSYTKNGDLDWAENLGPNSSYDLQLYNDVQIFADSSGIYTATLTDYVRDSDPDRPNERVFRKYRRDGSLAWTKNVSAADTPTAVAERGTSEVYVGGSTGSSDAFLLKLSAATGATLWSR